MLQLDFAHRIKKYVEEKLKNEKFNTKVCESVLKNGENVKMSIQICTAGGLKGPPAVSFYSPNDISKHAHLAQILFCIFYVYLI